MLHIAGAPTAGQLTNKCARVGVYLPMTTFVLVHGAWHDGSSWSQVVQRLESLGHNVFAPTLAGHGKGVDKNVGYPEMVGSVVDFIIDSDLTDFVLVAHSAGGPVISKAAEVISERIRRLVFYSGFVLNDGESIRDNWPPYDRILFGQLAAESPDTSVMIPFPIWREVFMNDADLGLALACYERLSPVPGRMFFEILDLKKFYELDIPRSYIVASEDAALPPGEWGWHPKMSGRLGLCRLVRMPGGHELFFTNPDGLADKIIEAGRD
jgi:pimeloyl-ACP methyl ester carboxylesterase